jgi:hypothetical protein
MIKVVEEKLCSDCMELLSLVLGDPLTRIACANCQQAKRDLPGKTMTKDGAQLRVALESLRMREQL